MAAHCQTINVAQKSNRVKSMPCKQTQTGIYKWDSDIIIKKPILFNDGIWPKIFLQPS